MLQENRKLIQIYVVLRSIVARYICKYLKGFYIRGTQGATIPIILSTNSCYRLPQAHIHDTDYLQVILVLPISFIILVLSIIINTYRVTDYITHTLVLPIILCTCVTETKTCYCRTAHAVIQGQEGCTRRAEVQVQTSSKHDDCMDVNIQVHGRQCIYSCHRLYHVSLPGRYPLTILVQYRG